MDAPRAWELQTRHLRAALAVGEPARLASALAADVCLVGSPLEPSAEAALARAQALAESGTWLVTLVASGVLMSLALLVMSYWTARLTERQQSAKRYLESANEELGERLREAERSHQQTVTLSKLYEDLMTCHDEVEYLTLAERYARQLFAECPGAMLLLHRPKEKLMRPAAPWGCWQEMATDIAEDACWAWRRQDVTTTQSPTDQMCRADGGGLHARPHCCVPLSAGGGRLGVFVLAMPETALRDAARRRLEDLAISFAQRVASGLHSLRLRNELHEQLIRDPLTALFNRRYLRETLATEVARAQRRKTPLSVLMLDIDHFKQLNDTYGHEAGDLVLKTVANSLQRNVRRGDVPCRYGGEEFVIVMPEATEAHAAARAGDLRLQVEQIALTYGGQILRTTISGGIATLSAEMKTEEDLLRAADKALYAAKMNGRNRIFVAEPAGDLHPLDEADQSLGSSSL